MKGDGSRGPRTHLLMPSKEASLQMLPLSVLTPRWRERGNVRARTHHTGRRRGAPASAQPTHPCPPFR